MIVNRCLERRLVGEPFAATAGIGGPGVIGLLAAAALSTIPALVAAPAAPLKPPPPLERWVLVTLADALRRDGPTSSTSTS